MTKSKINERNRGHHIGRSIEKYFLYERDLLNLGIYLLFTDFGNTNPRFRLCHNIDPHKD